MARREIGLGRRERCGELLGGLLVEHTGDVVEQDRRVREEAIQVAGPGGGDEGLDPRREPVSVAVAATPGELLKDVGVLDSATASIAGMVNVSVCVCEIDELAMLV